MDKTEQLELEQRLLRQAEQDIEQGWTRLRKQQDLLKEMRASGHDTEHACRLVALLGEILLQWERHRELIEQRVAYLKARREPWL